MSVIPRDFREHCDNIQEINDSEIVLRNVMSRGYYYAYLYVKTRWGDKDEYPNLKNKHKEAQKFLEEEIGEELANDLSDLHDLRKTADYELNENVVELDMMLSESVRDEIVQTIKNSTL